jgi:hypothetical protein
MEVKKMEDEYFKVIENKIENIKIVSFTNLWDDVILPLLESSEITELVAEAAYQDEYLNKVLNDLIIEYKMERGYEV